MPLVASSKLPTFEHLRLEGENVVSHDAAVRQDIRELHVGLLNMMPDAALAATERQFFRLIGQSNQIAQFYVHPFTFKELPRGADAQAHVAQYYETFEAIKDQGLDALIITGANVTQPDLSLEPFWKPLNRVIDWAYDNVTSTLCSCLATHAVLQFRYGQKRRHLGFKRWGVHAHRVVDRRHPLVSDVNTRFDVPHSRYNDVSRTQFENAGLHILAESDVAGVHLAVSEDRFRLVFFQGHIESRAQGHPQGVEEIKRLRHAFHHTRKYQRTPNKEQRRRCVCLAIEAGQIEDHACVESHVYPQMGCVKKELHR